MRFPITKYKFIRVPANEKHGKQIIAISTFAGKTVKGIASCNPADGYDEMKGMKIAAGRCAEKIARKRIKRAEDCLEWANELLEYAYSEVDRMQQYVDDAYAEYAETKTYLNEQLTANIGES